MAVKSNEGTALRFLYHTAAGRLLLHLLTARWVSKAAGTFLSSPLSRFLIPSFIRKAGIDFSELEQTKFRSFNDCFTRKIKPELRPILGGEEEIISPCDGLLSVYRIEDRTVLPVKQSRYTVDSLLQNQELAARYRDGWCFVFRLCVEHYHRYCYPVSGVKNENRFIGGKLHTVRPIALREVPVFCENCREYTTIQTDRFGPVTQMEVGALLVGKIQNDDGAGPVTKGAEKGRFLYGGSTIVLLFEKDAVKPLDPFLNESQRGNETAVKLGQIIAKK